MTSGLRFLLIYSSSPRGETRRSRKHYCPGLYRSEHWAGWRLAFHHREPGSFHIIRIWRPSQTVQPPDHSRGLLTRRRPHRWIHLRCRSANSLCCRERTLVTHPLLSTDFSRGGRTHLRRRTLLCWRKLAFVAHRLRWSNWGWAVFSQGWGTNNHSGDGHHQCASHRTTPLYAFQRTCLHF